jgi:hypothetical protein
VDEELTLTGSEHLHDFPTETGIRPQGGAQGGAVGAPITVAELAQLVKTCEQLPEHVRAAVLALLGTAG